MEVSLIASRHTNEQIVLLPGKGAHTPEKTHLAEDGMSSFMEQPHTLQAF